MGVEPLRTAEVVLIVDDDVAIMEALASALERDDRTIILCPDVESAQIVLEQYRVTRVIADVQMTGRRFGYEGLQLLEYVKAHASSIPIVLMSGAASDSLEEEARRHGARGLLSKPFRLDELERLLFEETL